MMLQAKLTGSSVVFSRKMGGTVMSVAYEVIHVPFVVRQFTTDFAAGELMKRHDVPNLPAATSVAFSTMQAISGQTSGSTEYADATTLDLVGEGTATLSVAEDRVTAERASGTAATSITWNAIDFGNDGCD
jgi:hypothetical protein